MAPKRRKMPQEMNTILRRALKRRGLLAPVKEHRVFDVWDEAVGPLIAANCSPVEVRRGVLMLRAKSPAWVHELTYQKGEILKKLNRAVGRGVIRDLRFTVARPHPTRQPAPLDTSGASAIPPSLCTPDADTKASVENTLSEIEDPELRATLASFLFRGAARRS